MWNKIKKHYHWVIAAVAIVQMLIYGGVINNLSNYHMIPICQTMDISRTAFSLAWSIRSVVCMLSALYSGVLLRHFGFRKSAAVGLALSAVCYGFWALADSYGMLLILCAGTGLAEGLCYTAGVSRLLNGWFHKHRGVILGLVTAATGVGSTLLGFVQSPAIEFVSWRLSLGIASAAFLLTALLVGLLVRDDPEKLGLRPYGEEEARKEKKQTISHWDGFTMDQLKKRPAYYLLLACVLLSCFSVTLISYNIVPFLQERGMAESDARSQFSTMMLVLGVVKLGAGVLCDRIGSGKVAILCSATCAVGVLLMMFLPATNACMFAALLVFVLALPATTMIFPLLSVELFGYRGQNQYIGTVMAMVSGATMISGPVASGVYDALGSYVPVLWFSVVLSAALCPVYMILFAMARRDRKKFENA